MKTELPEPLWEVIQREPLIDSPWLGVEAQTCRLPNGKTISPFYVVKQPDWVMVLAQDIDGFWIMGRQYRHGMGKWFLEFPAGIIDAGESPLDAAQRELREESGFAGGEWKYLRCYPVNPDRQSANFHIVVAQGVRRVGDTDFDESEFIHLMRYKGEEISDLIKRGGIEHPHHILAWLLIQSQSAFFV